MDKMNETGRKKKSGRTRLEKKGVTGQNSKSSGGLPGKPKVEKGHLSVPLCDPPWTVMWQERITPSMKRHFKG